MFDGLSDVDRGKITQQSETEFTAPETMTTSVASAQAKYMSLRQGHLNRIALYAEIRGLIQGNPPYNQQQLQEAGLDYVTNVNDMSAYAKVQRGCLAYWNLLYNTEYTCAFEVMFDTADAAEWANTLSKYWDDVMEEFWPSFYINTTSLINQLVELGISPIIFSDERSPKWNMVELSRFYIPDQTQTDPDFLTTAYVESEYTIQSLWNIYQKNKKLNDNRTDWNVAAIGKFLVRYANSVVKNAPELTDMLALENKMLSGDTSYTNLYSDSVKIISALEQEFDGKVSHYMFHRHFSVEDFMYKAVGQYESIHEALVIFTLHPGEYTIHANKGLGHKIFSMAQAKIQAMCSVVDMIKWASTPIVKGSSLNSKDVQQIKFYPGVVTDIGSCDFAQNNLGANVNEVVSGVQFIENTIETNINMGGDDPAQADPDQGSLSPSQVKIRATKEFNVLKNNIHHFYTSMDRVLRLMTAKMLRSKAGYPLHDMAQAWMDRCIKAGVPKQIFQVPSDEASSWKMPTTLRVKASRAMGAGSQAAQLSALESLQPFAGGFNVQEARAFKRDIIIATVGRESLPRYNNETGQPDNAAGGSSLAGVENAIMQAGKSPIFSEDNEQRSHVATHLALGQQLVQQREQNQMDAVTADSVFQVLIPHLGQHMEALSKDIFAQSFFKQVEQPYAELNRYATFNRKNADAQEKAMAKKQQEQSDNQNKVMNDEELKNMQVHNDENRKDIKLDAQNQRQEKAGQAKEQALAKKTDSEIRIKTAKANSDIAATQKKVAAELSNTATMDAQKDPAKAIQELNGKTISPNDIEPLNNINTTTNAV